MKTYLFQDRMTKADVRKATPKTYLLRLRFSLKPEDYIVELQLTQEELDEIRAVTNDISDKEDW